MKERSSATFVKWSIYILSFAEVASAVSSYMQFSLLQKLNSGVLSSTEFAILATSSDHRDQVIARLTLIVLIVSFSVSAEWLYKAAKFYSNVGATGLKFTPGWTVGWFCIPILNIWKPYQAVRQLYQVATDWRNWQSIPVPNIFRLWWGLWLFSNAVGQMLFRTSDSLTEIGSIQMYNLACVATLPIDLGLNYVFLKIVLDISGKLDSIEEPSIES